MSVSQIVKYKQLGIEIIHLRDAAYSYPEHTHSTTFTIGHISSGEIVLIKNNRDEVVAGSNTFTISPCEPHTILSKTVYSMSTISISTSFVQQTSLEQARSSLSLLDVDIPIPQLNKALDWTYSSCHQRAAPKDSHVEMMSHYIRQHPETRLTLEQIAETVYSSKYHLIRKFRKDVGLTPHRYQIQCQIRKAQNLLEKDITMTEVAQTVGFYDQSHFNKHFKAVVGMTPSEYKAALCIS